jgi:hypothetical protein
VLGIVELGGSEYGVANASPTELVGSTVAAINGDEEEAFLVGYPLGNCVREGAAFGEFHTENVLRR